MGIEARIADVNHTMYWTTCQDHGYYPVKLKTLQRVFGDIVPFRGMKKESQNVRRD